MAIHYINTGTSANAGNGDNLRVAFTKINENFRQIAGVVGPIIAPVINIGDTAPDSVDSGTPWFNSTDARLYIKYNNQWVDASPVILPIPEPDIEVQTITFNDQSRQTTAWTGTVSWENIVNKPVQLSTEAEGGSASTWLTSDDTSNTVLDGGSAVG